MADVRRVAEILQNGARQPSECSSPRSRRNSVSEAFSMSVSGIRHSAFTLVQSAMGGGALTSSYALKLTGMGLGSALFVVSAILSYMSVYVLIQLTTMSRCETYAKLFSHCAGPRAGPVLDAMIFLLGNGVCSGYFVFLSDCVPRLLKLIPHAAAWLVDRRFSIIAAVICVLPLALQKDLSALAKITPVSILALGLIVLGIVVQTPFESKHHGGVSSLEWFKMDTGFFDAFAITLFAFGCTLNVVPVAGSLVRPTRARIIQVSVWTNVVQVIFYLVIAVCGYMSFGDDTEGDILNGYADDNIIVVISRALFACSMLLSLSMNLSPTVRSGLHLIDYFCSSELLIPSPTASPPASPQLGPARRPSLLEGVPSEAAWPRIALTIACLMAQAGIAIAVPGIGDIISIIGGTICPAIMLTIPAYAMGVVMHPMTGRRRLIQVTMYAFSILGYTSAPLKVLQMAGVLK